MIKPNCPFIIVVKVLNISLIDVWCLQAGLSQVHFTAERSSYYPQLIQAEEKAKSQKLKVESFFIVLDNVAFYQCK